MTILLLLEEADFLVQKLLFPPRPLSFNRIPVHPYYFSLEIIIIYFRHQSPYRNVGIIDSRIPIMKLLTRLINLPLTR